MNKLVDKILERLNELRCAYEKDYNTYHLLDDLGNMQGLENSITIIEEEKEKYSKNCSDCKNNTAPDEVDNGCYMCSKGFESNFKPKQTNAERIRSMSIEELAKLLLCPYDVAKMSCVKEGNIQGNVSPKECQNCMLEWLRKEVET